MQLGAGYGVGKAGDLGGDGGEGFAVAGVGHAFADARKTAARDADGEYMGVGFGAARDGEGLRKGKGFGGDGDHGGPWDCGAVMPGRRVWFKARGGVFV